MTTMVFVVSDLHLGGADGFRMCDRSGQARLAEFFEWIASYAGVANDVSLVLAGDLVDFLAESDPDGTWSAFTDDEALADHKLRHILESTAPVWDALAACVRHRVRLTMILGNHDIELSLPRVRRRLLDRVGPGAVELLYDNQAYTRGKLIVEHGNQYEAWNSVDHDALRRVRARLSRGESAGEFPAQPGSLLVARLMNKIKARYPWVDLLKPETAGVLPILVALEPGLLRGLGQGLEFAARAAWRRAQLENSWMRGSGGFVSEQVVTDRADLAPFPDEEIFAWISELDADSGSSFVSDVNQIRTDVLFAALRKWAAVDHRTFAVEQEDRRYLRAATALATRGYEVVVFGHTHHVKRILLHGPPPCTYLNTGTWADLIRTPEKVFTGNEEEARAAFSPFLDNLRQNRLSDLRRLVPTFAQIELDADGSVLEKNIYFFDGPANVTPVTTEGVFARLGNQ